MLQAVLRRKLTRAEEGMEDLLTSNTFGMMKYLPPEAALLPFLRAAINPLTDTKLESLLDGVTGVDQWRFWPWLEYPDCKGCEPDVELRCSGGNSSGVLVLVEAKFRSGKSSFATEEEERPNDQLAREYDNATRAAGAGGLAGWAVVYVTTDPICPEAEIRESAAEYRAKRGCDPGIYWTSWRFLPDVLEPVALAGSEMAGDLRELLLGMDLTTFNRLRFGGVKSPVWGFQRTVTRWRWSIPAFAWHFDHPRLEADPEVEETAAQDGPRKQEFCWDLTHQPHSIYQWRRHDEG